MPKILKERILKWNDNKNLEKTNLKFEKAFNQIADFCDFYDKKVPKTTRGLAYPTNTKATAPAASSSFLCGLAAVKLDKKKFELSEGKVIFTLIHSPISANLNFQGWY